MFMARTTLSTEILDILSKQNISCDTIQKQLQDHKWDNHS